MPRRCWVRPARRARGLDHGDRRLFASPFVTFRANRIAAGEPRSLFEALPSAAAIAPAGLDVAVAVLARRGSPSVASAPRRRFGSGAAAAGDRLGGALRDPAGNTFARVSPALGLLAPALALALCWPMSLTRLRFGPWERLLSLSIAAALLGSLLVSGAWNDLSLMKEYAKRADSFWREAQQHVFLALGSLCGGDRRRPAARHPVPSHSGAAGHRRCRSSTSSRPFPASRCSAS